ncbi:M16 family metallopeptidase [Salisediminibacterium beveridgei]|uniref:Peptidase, M16 family n=1 Tax=Salisediminibacterium beveridgei TaxID=632773 RepID=A0A1D7QVU5_9BACI|nr:pitrilysin family protein [Salisediminibacterium beveridgei]AOM83136.1 peptidase, M16 family [Salisediminibacterium beveridgei]
MVHRVTAPNGLRIVYEPLQDVRSVSMGIWIGTGSRYETDEEKGISHFIEHMLFKGTATRSPQEIAASFDAIGGYVNAMTSKEYTCYYAKVLDSHADQAMDVLSDMFFNSRLAAEDIVKEQAVVLEEIKMYDDTPDDLVHEQLSEISYGKHPLAGPILGYESTIRQFDFEQLKSYIDQTYTADNVVISICGHVDETFIKRVLERFSAVPAGQQRPIYPPTFISGEKGRKREADQAHLAIGFEGVSADSGLMYPLVLLNNAIGGSMSSRLFQEIREERGLAYAVYSIHEAYRDSGLLTIYAGCAMNQLDRVYDVILKNLQTVKTDGLTELEWQNGREQLKGSLMLGLEGTSSRMQRNGRNELILGRHRTLDDVLHRIDSITQKDISDVASYLFSQTPSISVVSGEGKLPLR